MRPSTPTRSYSKIPKYYPFLTWIFKFYYSRYGSNHKQFVLDRDGQAWQSLLNSRSNIFNCFFILVLDRNKSFLFEHHIFFVSFFFFLSFYRYDNDDEPPLKVRSSRVTKNSHESDSLDKSFTSPSNTKSSESSLRTKRRHDADIHSAQEPIPEMPPKTMEVHVRVRPNATTTCEQKPMQSATPTSDVFKKPGFPEKRTLSSSDKRTIPVPLSASATLLASPRTPLAKPTMTPTQLDPAASRILLTSPTFTSSSSPPTPSNECGRVKHAGDQAPLEGVVALVKVFIEGHVNMSAPIEKKLEGLGA
jgi:hypothetical protein